MQPASDPCLSVLMLYACKYPELPQGVYLKQNKARVKIHLIFLNIVFTLQKVDGMVFAYVSAPFYTFSSIW